MQRTNKATHAAFLLALDAELLAIGAEKFEHSKKEEWRDAVPGYRFSTRHGVLELHPYVPIRYKGGSADYNITVFGRFPDADRAYESFGQWKWNHHLGYREIGQVAECAQYIAQRTAALLPAPAEMPAYPQEEEWRAAVANGQTASYWEFVAGAAP